MTTPKIPLPVEDVWPDDGAPIPDDSLRPARGCLVGVILAGLAWVVILGGLALLVALVARHG